MKYCDCLDKRDSYLGRLLSNPVPKKKKVFITTIKQGWGKVSLNRSILGTDLCLKGKKYDSGFGVHCESELLLSSEHEISRFQAFAGINDSNYTREHKVDDVVFELVTGGKCILRSSPVCVADEPFAADIELPAGTRELLLKAETVSGNTGFSHVSWCDVVLIGKDGQPFEVAGGDAMDFVPFTFFYGELSSEALLPIWDRRESEEDHGSFIRRTFHFTNPEDGFGCDFILDRWKEHPVSYWKVEFFNNGNNDSGRLHKVRILSDNIPADHFTCARGAFDIRDKVKKPSLGFDDNFHRRIFTGEDEFIHIDGGCGKSSKEWMPFVEIGEKTGGCIFAVGWTGQWNIDLLRKDNYVHVEAGMEDIDTFLMPGERITQPSIMRIDYTGTDPIKGHNILRRFLREEWYPKQPEHLPVCVNTWGGMPAEKHLEHIDIFTRNGLRPDCYWIDAGWFGHGKESNKDEFAPYWSKNVGCWEINENVYPNGIREISDAVHAYGGKLMLWFELERAAEHSDIVNEHPEYFFKGTANRWLDLGNRQAADWMLNTLTKVMKEERVDYYRQDSNADALPFWRENDKPGRKGISEIRAVEGLYYVLEELKKRFPDILIDNCASGGRRIDIEMLRRSVVLWPTDLLCYPDFDCETMQEISAGLNYWIPAFSLATQYRPEDTYNFRSNLANGMNLMFFMYEYTEVSDKLPWKWLKKMTAEHRRAQPYLSGDYYPIVGQSYDSEKWMILQFDRPDMKGGLVNAMRRRDSCFKTAEICLKGLEPDTVYILEDADCGVLCELTGSELMEKGLSISITERGSAKLIFYTAKSAEKV